MRNRKLRQITHYGIIINKHGDEKIHRYLALLSKTPTKWQISWGDTYSRETGLPDNKHKQNDYYLDLKSIVKIKNPPTKRNFNYIEIYDKGMKLLDLSTD